MIDWVNDACLEWSRQVRARDYPNSYPSLGELESYNYLHNPAGLTDDAQELSAAVFRMRTVPAMLNAHNVLVAHYLFDGKVKAKIHILGTDKARYWNALHDGHCYLSARVRHPLMATA